MRWQRDIREFLPDEPLVKPNTVEGDKRKRILGICAQPLMAFPLDHRGSSATDGPPDDGDLVVVMAQPGCLDVEKQHALRVLAAEGQLLLKAQRQGRPALTRIGSWRSGEHHIESLTALRNLVAWWVRGAN